MISIYITFDILFIPSFLFIILLLKISVVGNMCILMYDLNTHSIATIMKIFLSPIFLLAQSFLSDHST